MHIFIFKEKKNLGYSSHTAPCYVLNSDDL